MTDSSLSRIASVHIADLMFESKLDHMFSSLGLTKQKIRGATEFLESLPTIQPAIIILDLRSKKLDCAELVGSLRSAKFGYAGPILCFGSHIFEDALEAARSAGADEVVANSVMSARGAKIIERLLGQASG